MSDSTTDITNKAAVRRMAEQHVADLVAAIISSEASVEFGEREGPCIVEYREWQQWGWPMRQGFSCLGCRHHERDAVYRNSLCTHPDFLEKYGCRQSVARGDWRRLELAEVHAFSCPVLRRLGVKAHCPSVPPDEQKERAPSKVYRRFFPNEEADIFKIPQSLPYWLKNAYERGEAADL